MAPRPVTREKLCELFWDVADDPRSELRWCLSKLRPPVDRPETTRIIADGKQVWIETSSLDVDALSVACRTQKAVAGSSPNELRSLLDSSESDPKRSWGQACGATWCPGKPARSAGCFIRRRRAFAHP